MISLLLLAAVAIPPAVAFRRAGLAWLNAGVAVFVWVWAIFVLTANLLSPFSLLGNRAAYAICAVALSLGSIWLIGKLSRMRPVADVDHLLATAPAAGPPSGWKHRVLFVAAVMFLALGFAWNVVVALAVEPVNPDTLMYRLPRVWWYLAQGNLLHYTHSFDPRALYYPFNVSLAYVPLALYGAAPVAFNLVSVVAWVVTGAVTFLLSRWMGVGRSVAAFVTLLVALAPIVFVEATSTNDEIIAAAGVTAGIYFFLSYFRGGSRLDLAIATAGLGCGLGAKLHFFFFWPAVLVLGAWLVIAAWRHEALRRYVLNGRRLRDVALALVLAMLLSVPFLIYNRLSSPHFAYSGDEARNSPFSMHIAGQTFSLLTAQLFFSPFPTFVTSVKVKARQRPIKAWNDWWNTHVFTNVDQSPAAMLATYRFRGVTDPMAAKHFENTEWAGLLPWLLVVSGVTIAIRRRPHDWLAAALAVAMLAWWVCYCATMKYFDTVGVYFAYPLIVCGSFVAVALSPGVPGLLSRVVWVIGFLVAAGHLVLCWNVAAFNRYSGVDRVVIALQSGRAVDTSAPALGLGKVLAGLDRATILATHWAVPYYEIIKTAPFTPYFVAPSADLGREPLIVAIQGKSFFDGYLPLKVSLPPDRGLVYLDTIQCSYGAEWIFGDAASFKDRVPEAHSRYLVFQVRLDESQPDSRTLRITPAVLGGDGPRDSLKYRYSLTVGGKATASRDWAGESNWEIPIADATPEQIHLQIEVAGADGGPLGDATFDPFVKKNGSIAP